VAARFAQALDAAGIPYRFVGGLAVYLHVGKGRRARRDGPGRAPVASGIGFLQALLRLTSNF
jgi:hypothetical protein